MGASHASVRTSRSRPTLSSIGASASIPHRRPITEALYRSLSILNRAHRRCRPFFLRERILGGTTETAISIQRWSVAVFASSTLHPLTMRVAGNVAQERSTMDSLSLARTYVLAEPKLNRCRRRPAVHLQTARSR